MSFITKRVALCTLAGLLIAGMAVGQSVTGNVFGTINSPDGSALPGVTVTLGTSPEKTQTTNTQGQFRFLGIDPGTYALRAELDGFSSVEYPAVTVSIGRNTTVDLDLSPAVDETITVTSETPLLDERKLQQGAQITQTELEKIPTARDPWAILNQTPGVLTDRVNVGGNESGQQQSFSAMGVGDGENDFNVDGVSITDMRATGASPTYYDFDQFAEMQFTTGGTDVTKNTAGVSVNLVTKRGSNEFRGSARFYNVKSGGYFGGGLRQSSTGLSQSDLGTNSGGLQCFPNDTNPNCISTFRGNEIREIEEMGFEAGGAAVRDRLWVWGSWGQNDIQQNAASGTADDTILENQSLKVNAQLTQSNSLVASWNNGDKQKFGRGAGPTRTDPTTWNQRGPSAIYRFEDTHVFSSNLFVTGTYSLGDFGFSLATKAGTGDNAPLAFRDENFVWQDNFLSGFSEGPNDEFKVDGSYFFSTGNLSHELKVGGRLREYESYSAFRWPGENNLQTRNNPGGRQVRIRRGVSTPSVNDYFSLWAQDTISAGNLTLNLGLRYDDQSGVNEAFVVEANRLVPDILPALNYAGNSEEFEWQSIAPRIGATYALGEERNTLLRASFAQFADQLSVGTINRTNPAGTAYAVFSAPSGAGAYTGDGTDLNLIGAIGFDPADPAALISPNVNDPNMDAPITSELVLAVEHALMPEFIVGLTFTARNVDDILELRDFIRDETGAVRIATRDDYVLDTTVGNGGFISGTISNPNAGGPALNYSQGVFALRPGLSINGGQLLTNGSRERNYEGFAVNFTKRLANRWMLRGYVNYGEAEWDVPDEFLVFNNPNRSRFGGDRDGDLYLDRVTGSGIGETFLQSSWSANLNGMYQVAPDRPWGFNISGSVAAREGYPLPYYENSVETGDGSINVGVLDELDSFRLDDLLTVDLRVEKEFAVSSAVNFNFGIDVFNITNEGTALDRTYELNSGRRYFVDRNVSPRIYRLGVRLSWK